MNDKASKREAIGEVVASSATGLTVQARPKGRQANTGNVLAEVYRPAFGSFISAQSIDANSLPITVVALVYNVLTGPKDNMHQTQALGLSRAELLQKQPQIFSLFQTEIQAQIIGFLQGDRVFHNLPAHPPFVHEFVYPLSNHEICKITESMGFLRAAARVTAVPSDELLAASILEAANARAESDDFLLEAGRALAELFQEDYDRLVFVLEKIKP